MKKLTQKKLVVLILFSVVVIIGWIMFRESRSLREREREREREQSPLKPNRIPNPKPLFPLNPTEPEPCIPPAPPGISENEARDKVLNKYYFFGKIARVLQEDIPFLLSDIPYQGDKYSSSTFEEIVARNEAILKQKKLSGFTAISANSSENYNKLCKMRKEKQRFLFISLTPRKADNTVDWKRLLEMIEHEITLLSLDKIEEYIRNKVNPELTEWFEAIPGSGGFPSEPAERLVLFNKIIEDNTDIELPMKILISMWENLKSKKRVWMGCTYFKLSIDPDDGGIIELNCKHGDN